MPTAAAIFAGCMERLDYLEDLGVTAVWLLPFYPSPWRDDGYDIADYTDNPSRVRQAAGFQAFLKEAHRRGIRVITELVLNHTSRPASVVSALAQRQARYRDGGTSMCGATRRTKYKEARIIFRDYRQLELDVGSGRKGILLASLLFASAGSELR